MSLNYLEIIYFPRALIDYFALESAGWQPRITIFAAEFIQQKRIKLAGAINLINLLKGDITNLLQSEPTKIKQHISTICLKNISIPLNVKLQLYMHRSKSLC